MITFNEYLDITPQDGSVKITNLNYQPKKGDMIKAITPFVKKLDEIYLKIVILRERKQ